MPAAYLTDTRVMVVKLGSALVAEGSAARQSWLNSFLADVAIFRNRGVQIVLVSSGAMALGRPLLGSDKPRKLEEKQACAALGQPLLMAALSDAAAPQGLSVAQSLLTLEDTENRRRWLNARATLQTLLKARDILPVINENDTVATDEIRYGDNDRLAARVAQMIGADTLVLLSDIDGLYTADPRSHAEARHVPEVTALSQDVLDMAGGANADTGVGSGGMVTKLAAAQIAWSAGCRTVITKGFTERPLSALDGGARATWFKPPLTPETARQAWLSGHLSPEGSVHVDAGAAGALRQKASLLPVGVTQVDGGFERGAAVSIRDPHGLELARGITAYSAEDIRQIAGLHTDEMADVLGYRGRPAVIHRDDLILTGNDNSG
ncbi:MAG: glutamate 5-kinase [Pseudomonadota bacterium]